ncbi:hypothetical protein CEXT_752511 [Caerostris extrusa]|uniref:Uncharacterized protein n=1 Tax=Caerostris extrusa TaxID=172846 RepID=A0AAV4Q1P6_CAEEX|nr:hypothetical protein CEXT_752511 [Caerostris extrusa]
MERQKTVSPTELRAPPPIYGKSRTVATREVYFGDRDRTQTAEARPITASYWQRCRFFTTPAWELGANKKPASVLESQKPFRTATDHSHS